MLNDSIKDLNSSGYGELITIQKARSSLGNSGGSEFSFIMIGLSVFSSLSFVPFQPFRLYRVGLSHDKPLNIGVDPHALIPPLGLYVLLLQTNVPSSSTVDIDLSVHSCSHLLTSEHAPDDHLCLIPRMIQGRPDSRGIVNLRILESTYASCQYTQF